MENNGQTPIGFVEYLKGAIDNLNSEIKNAFAQCLQNNDEEKSLTKTFIDDVLKHCEECKDVVPPTFPKGQKFPGFFDYNPIPNDVKLQYHGKKVLLECKPFRSKKGYEVQNGSVQLLSYLLSGEWDDGCLVIFDVRGNASGAVFDECSEQGKRNGKLLEIISKFDLLPPSESRRLSAIHLYADNDQLKVEIWPTHEFPRQQSGSNSG